ncbi:hypothetical protein C440_05802 [Haloferax mucosum ATCC BAA-1512]|uniref:Uncharacterized protein n=1 Tax=Haloferax mucosum ATCC BAA-1512 TaxID=662479 RepID=M0IH34_9EURY|nr:hypothetical protein [Haloferax mucosum]ELZ96080.1 hypothetical protein C440_05802 [Haloferax mucosum ATCC BAA-1512]
MFKYVFGGLLFIYSAWSGYHLLKNGLLYHSLSGVEPTSIGTVVDGERIAVKGTVTIDDPAPASKEVIPHPSRRIGMYVWRVAKNKPGSNKIDFRNLKVKANKKTVGSGIEAGTLAVSSDGTTVRVDPTWVREAHGAPKLTDFTVVPGMGYRNFRLYLWRTPYVRLSGDEAEVPLDQLEGVVEKYDAETSLADMWLQSRPLEAGDTLTVYGEVHSTGGTPVIRGTDETPLFITNDSIDGLRRYLLKLMSRNASSSGFFLVLTVLFVFYANW